MINFKSYLTEESENLLTEEVVDSSDLSDLNDILYSELERSFLSPEAGMQKIRQVLATIGVPLPMVFDLDSDGSEFVIDMKDYGIKALLYVLYSLSEDGYYEFYAEFTDEAGVEELFSDGDEEEE